MRIDDPNGLRRCGDREGDNASHLGKSDQQESDPFHNSSSFTIEMCNCSARADCRSFFEITFDFKRCFDAVHRLMRVAANLLDEGINLH